MKYAMITEKQIETVQKLFNELEEKQQFYFKMYSENKKDKKAKSLMEYYTHKQMGIAETMKAFGFDFICNPNAKDYVENNQTWVFAKVD